MFATWNPVHSCYLQVLIYKYAQATSTIDNWVFHTGSARGLAQIPKRALV